MSRKPLISVAAGFAAFMLFAGSFAEKGGSAEIELLFQAPREAAKIPMRADKDTLNVSLIYRGGEVSIFGVAPDSAEHLIALMRSKETPPMELSRKERVAFFWLSTKKFKVENIPGMYQLTATSLLKEALSNSGSDVSERYQLGYAALKNEMKVHQTAGEEAADDVDVLFDGIVKIKEGQGLYRIEEGNFRMYEGGLFNHKFPITDSAPVGEYTIKVIAFKGGEIIGEGSAVVMVAKAGIVKWLYNLAMTKGGLYGVLAVIIAFSAGIGVSMVFKRGGGH